MTRGAVEGVVSTARKTVLASCSAVGYALRAMSTLALTELLGLPVFEPDGGQCGRLRELAVAPQEDRARIAVMIVRTKSGDRVMPFSAVNSMNGGLRIDSAVAAWPIADGSEGLFLLVRDLLDQQIIDVHGRKVVRVNDVELYQDLSSRHPVLRVGSVDVGARGAVRRLLKGVVPIAALRALLRQIPERQIPWDFVDLIETDPAPRVKPKTPHEPLARLHPADIADIVEDLAPNEREAVFETLDHDVAAEALEEVEPKVQKAIVESLDSDRAADIVEEMNPDAAADLLGDLSDERTEEILGQMQPQERQEVTDLLEFKENTAAGRMPTEFIALPVTATAHDAIDAMRKFEGRMENMSTIYLTDSHGTLAGAVPLVKIVLAPPSTPLLALAQEPLISCHENAKEKEFAELFDKYNLLTLPVIDEHNRLAGVITPDDVIAMLRSKL